MISQRYIIVDGVIVATINTTSKSVATGEVNNGARLIRKRTLLTVKLALCHNKKRSLLRCLKECNTTSQTTKDKNSLTVKLTVCHNTKGRGTGEGAANSKNTNSALRIRR